ncbi:MAG: ThiF family adenylyltransferase [Chloroflexota bacterium]|nr:ThiF family adenylyltransferase [Chloroflexota bacterium]
MVRPELRISEADWRRIREDLDRSFRSEHGHERGALAVLGEIRTEGRHVFTVAEVLMPEPGDVDASRGGLTFRSHYIRRAHLRMRSRALAGIATFHTHPLADDEVDFSPFDDSQDPPLIANLTELADETRLVSVVLGRRSQAARVWTSDRCIEPLSHLTVVGERFVRLPLDGTPPPPAPGVAAAFDRAAALTDAGALALLRSLTVAVVGVSGIGSLVAELLGRAGCGRVLLVDDERVGDENLNRILYATTAHARARVVKVGLLADAVNGTGLGTVAEPIEGNVLVDEVLTRLRGADLIIGCVDRAWPRDLLSAFSFRSLIPYIDLGTEIGTDDKAIAVESLDARVSYVAPGRWCLVCAGFVDPRRVAFESQTTEERKRIVDQGYSDDLLLRQPAVMELNMRAASLGVLVLRHLLQPFLPEPLPVAIKENLAMLSLRLITDPRSPRERCPICRDNLTFGYGDCAPALGYPKAAVDARVKRGG